jgi:hypothetical protein
MLRSADAKATHRRRLRAAAHRCGELTVLVGAATGGNSGNFISIPRQGPAFDAIGTMRAAPVQIDATLLQKAAPQLLRKESA